MFSNVDKVTNLRITDSEALPSPAELCEDIARTSEQKALVTRARKEMHDLIQGKDKRLLAVIGPCSIHDLKACREYAERFAKLAEETKDRLLLLMRVYFEKPRTTVGWKGLINDPHLDGSFDINSGLRTARGLLVQLADMGLPAGSEFLDTISPQFIADLICWGAIGARTTESQIHRELASGLSMPVGFKNGTDGNVQIALDAIGAARHRHHFLSVTKQGISAIVETAGNALCHLILRGGSRGTNFDADSVGAAADKLREASLPQRIMVDCSHGNSSKDPERQPAVLQNVMQQVTDGNRHIHSVMMESNLKAGNQKMPANLEELEYGVSITDGCLDWVATEKALRDTHAALASRIS